MKVVVFAPGIQSLADQQLADSVIGELGNETDFDVVTVDGDVAGLPPGFSPLGFFKLGTPPGRTPEDRDTRLAGIRAAAAGMAGGIVWQDPAWDVITAIADADAVLLIGGGGNSFPEPEAAYELVGLVDVALVFGKPAVLVGFQLADHLIGSGGQIVTEAIRASALLGVIDPSSFDWAISQGVSPSRLRQYPIGLSLMSPPAIPVTPDDSLPNAYIAAELGHLTDVEFAAGAITRVVESLSAWTGLPTVLMKTASTESSSVEAPGSHGSITQVSVRSPQQSAAITAGASLVLSTESMTLRVAAHGAVPMIGIGSDESSMFVVADELQRIGMMDWAASAESLGTGDLTRLAKETWTRRTEIRDHLRSVVEEDCAASRRWWDDVANVLNGQDAATPRASHLHELVLRDQELASRVAFSRQLSRWTQERHLAETLKLRELVDELAVTQRERDQAKQQFGELHADLLDTELRLAQSEAALAAAHALTAELAEPLFARALRPPVVPYSKNALNDLLQSRTMRWSSGLRAMYGRLRRSIR